MHHTYNEGIYLVRMEVGKAEIGDDGILLITQTPCIRQSSHEKITAKSGQHCLQAADFCLAAPTR